MFDELLPPPPLRCFHLALTQHARHPSPVPCLGYGSHALLNIKFLFAFGMQYISEYLGEKCRGHLMRLLDSNSVLSL